MLRISGELMRDDYNRFAALATETYPEDVMESTADNTVCLDSPGASLSEGVKFARHFYKEGVGTVIEDGASCHSACAVMFMMGTAQGAEVAFVNRKLHARGTLGFHRPYLRIESGPRVDAAALALAYDGAFQSALDLIAMAKSPWTNTPMMKPDLVEAMLSHVGDDMFLIETIDRAARFDVETFGYPVPEAFGEAEAFYACEDSLQWQQGLMTQDITFTAEVAGGYRHGDVLRPPGNGQRIVCQMVNDKAMRWSGGAAAAAARDCPEGERPRLVQARNLRSALP